MLYELNNYIYVLGKDIDLREFYHLPLHMQADVLFKGKKLLVKDENALEYLYFKISRMWRDEEHFYNFIMRLLRGALNAKTEV